MRFNLLALDQSTTCSGWCVFKEGKYHSSGFFTPKSDDTDDRIREVYEFLTDKMMKEGIRIVALEDIFLKEKKKDNPFIRTEFYSNTNVHKVLGELLGACKMAVRNNDRVFRTKIIPAVSWKSFHGMLGKGIDRDKQKKMAILYASKISGKVITDDNEGDVVCMAYYADREVYSLNEELRKGEFKVEKENGEVYPHVFKYWEKKEYNELGEHTGIKLTKEVKVIVGKTLNGKNKWGKEIKDFSPSELSSMNKDMKIQFLEKLKERGFKSPLSEAVWNKQLEYINSGGNNGK